MLRIFQILMIMCACFFMFNIRQAHADWNQEQQGIYDDGLFIGQVAMCVEFDGSHESMYIVNKFAEHLRDIYIQKYGKSYVDSPKFRNPMSSGIAVGSATQRQRHTRGCDQVLDHMQRVSKKLGFDVRAAYEEAQSQ